MTSSTLPQKRYYRQRAHSNPMAHHTFDYPVCPEEMDWSKLYPKLTPGPSSGMEGPRVEFADIGCGYGGLLVELSPLFPDKLILGLEIRVKVSDYVQDRIRSLRDLNPGSYQNIACLRSNAMKYLPNFFFKGQLSKMFFLFPDPHFKKTKHKWRIVSSTLLAEYAYTLRVGVLAGPGGLGPCGYARLCDDACAGAQPWPGDLRCIGGLRGLLNWRGGTISFQGLVYTITDVEEVHVWMVKHFSEHPLFARVPDEELVDDIIVGRLSSCTEEGKKVQRNGGKTYLAVFRRIEDSL